MTRIPAGNNNRTKWGKSLYLGHLVLWLFPASMFVIQWTRYYNNIFCSTRYKYQVYVIQLAKNCLVHSWCLLQIGDESPDIYVYVLSHPPLIYMWVSVCTFMCIYLFSCPSVPAPQLLIFHREYLGWYIVDVYQS